MRLRFALLPLSMVCLLFAGCTNLPGKPGFRPETLRPDQTMGFAILYKNNCSACHGDHGQGGAAIPLNNPVYLDWAGKKQILTVVENGVAGYQMPGFAAGSGGLLTGAQVDAIVNGMQSHWAKPGSSAGAPGYQQPDSGDTAHGQAVFTQYCARCHGAQGDGNPAAGVTGSILNPTYLSLISKQGMRSIIVAGMPGEGMPDWKDDVAGKPMTDADVTDVVAWLASHRVTNPGQPFSQAHQ
jgi:mono/diheme cytochrome c family protein